ncbi:hypothetical protein PR003_g18080 [Phytophthora rubi]|uniref:Secreted protein n=1 Tax=Phytophthora rubi TaxID=129364 RepID=A0A6A4E3H6_9STRA|nr:hypothetical protein PR003_g18080 [Phytophthora rubi]
MPPNDHEDAVAHAGLLVVVLAAHVPSAAQWPIMAPKINASPLNVHLCRVIGHGVAGWPDKQTNKSQYKTCRCTCTATGLSASRANRSEKPAATTSAR